MSVIDDPRNDFDFDTVSVFKDLYDQTDPKGHQKLADQPWQSAKTVRIHFVWGERGSGKSSAMEESAEIYYNSGLNIWHLWAARSYENWFWCINKNCKREFEQKTPLLTEEQQDILKDRLHCNCHKAYPILVLVPDYVEFDDDTIKRFNGVVWKDMEEYRQAVRNGWIGPDLGTSDKEKILKGKLRKPDYLLPKTELFQYGKIVIPKNPTSREIFKKQFTEHALRARKEHRVLSMNPQSFADGDQFRVLAEIMKMLPDFVEEHFQELDEEKVGRMRGINRPVPKTEWTKRERGHNKIVIVLNEIRTIAPSAKYLPQKEAAQTKRPIVDAIPELRHFSVWFMGDLQNPDDLNSSVRPQANNVVIKRANKELLGDEWSGFFKTIYEKRNREFERYLGRELNDGDFVPPEIRDIVSRKYPKIEELPNNKGYVVFRNGEFFLETFDYPSFHHKKEGESFRGITGISWTKNVKKAEKSTDKQDGDTIVETSSGRQEKEKSIKKAIDLYKDLRNWNDVIKKLYELVEKGELPKTGNELLTGKALSTKINRDKKYRDLLRKTLGK